MPAPFEPATWTEPDYRAILDYFERVGESDGDGGYYVRENALMIAIVGWLAPEDWDDPPKVGTPEDHAWIAFTHSSCVKDKRGFAVRHFDRDAMKHLRWAAGDLPILSDHAAAIYALLLDTPAHQGLTGTQILNALSQMDIIIDQGALTSRYIPELRAYGIENSPRRGYRIPESRRPRR